MARAVRFRRVIAQPLVAQHIAVVIDPRPHAASTQGDVGHGLQRRQRGGDPVIGRLPVDLAAVHRGAAAPMGGLFDQQHLGATLCRRFRGGQPGHAAADHHHVGEEIEMLVTVGVALFRSLAEARRLPDERFVDVFPERPGVDEGLVVEPGRKKARKGAVHRAHVEIEAGPVVLALRAQPVEQLGCGGALVRLERRPLPETDQRVGFLGAAGDDAARAVILERAADQHLVVGQQRRGERVAGKAPQALAVEAEGDGAGAVDQPALVGKASAHAGTLSQRAAGAM